MNVYLQMPRVFDRPGVILAFWIAFTPVALLIAFWSAGYGHGDYVLARILLPFACLVSNFTWRSTSVVPIMAAAVLQYPIYAFLLSTACRRHKRWPIAAVWGLHFFVVVLLFTVLQENFS